MMGQPTGEDKYIRAKEMVGQAKNTMNTAQLGILSAGIVAGQMAENYAEKVLAGKKAVAAMEQQKGKATLDESQKNLEAIAEDVEERAEDAVNPEEKDVTESSTATDAVEDADDVENAFNAGADEVKEENTTLQPRQNTDSAKNVIISENTAPPLVPTQPSIDIIV